MAVVGDPLERMREKLARRLRRFTVYHSILAAVSVAAIGWIVLPSGPPSLVWAFVYLAVVMPVGVPVVWWLNRRFFRRAMAAFEPFRSWIVDARVLVGTGYLLILSSGLVLGLDPRSNTLRCSAYFSPGGALVHPDAAQAERWGSRIRGMTTEGAITKKKGPSDAQQELEQFQAAFGARWYMFFLREVRSERLAAGDPMWHEVLAFLIPRWPEHMKEVANELERLTSFMVEARAKYFPHGASGP